MTIKRIICFAVLLAVIEAYPRYVAIPIEEYQALRYGKSVAQSRSIVLPPILENNAPLVRHRRSTPQLSPLLPNNAPLVRHRRSTPQFSPLASRSQQYRPYRQQQYATRPSYSFEPQYEQLYDASVQNEVIVEPEQLPAVRPFTGGYDGTPQYRPGQVVYVEEGPGPDLAQGASSTHEKRDAGYGGGGHGGGGDDHVDYGAYTGSYGAFGWYSDHPVCLDCGYH